MYNQSVDRETRSHTHTDGRRKYSEPGCFESETDGLLLIALDRAHEPVFLVR